jgi:hypothetical protein
MLRWRKTSLFWSKSWFSHCERKLNTRKKYETTNAVKIASWATKALNDGSLFFCSALVFSLQAQSQKPSGNANPSSSSLILSCVGMIEIFVVGPHHRQILPSNARMMTITRIKPSPPLG